MRSTAAPNGELREWCCAAAAPGGQPAIAAPRLGPASEALPGLAIQRGGPQTLEAPHRSSTV